MRRIDERTVELTDEELACGERFNELLDRGLSLPLAAQMALNKMRVEDGFPTDEYIAYLSDDTCRRWGQRIMMRPQWRIATDTERKERRRLDQLRNASRLDEARQQAQAVLDAHPEDHPDGAA